MAFCIDYRLMSDFLSRRLQGWGSGLQCPCRSRSSESKQLINTIAVSQKPSPAQLTSTGSKLPKRDILANALIRVPGKTFPVGYNAQEKV